MVEGLVTVPRESIADKVVFGEKNQQESFAIKSMETQTGGRELLVVLEPGVGPGIRGRV